MFHEENRVNLKKQKDNRSNEKEAERNEENDINNPDRCFMYVPDSSGFCSRTERRPDDKWHET